MHFGAIVKYRANEIDTVYCFHRRIVNQLWQLSRLAVLTLVDDMAFYTVLLCDNYLHAARCVRHQIELLFLLTALAC